MDKLHKNGVDIEIDALWYYFENIKEKHDFIYRAIVEKSIESREMFYEMTVNNLGRAMVYLTFVYVSNCSKKSSQSLYLNLWSVVFSKENVSMVIPIIYGHGFAIYLNSNAT